MRISDLAIWKDCTPLFKCSDGQLGGEDFFSVRSALTYCLFLLSVISAKMDIGEISLSVSLHCRIEIKKTFSFTV